MPRAFLLFLFSCALLVGPQAAMSQQSGALFGLETENDALAWRAVGRLDAEGAGFCTATLISPEFVLTAAHCVFDAETGKRIAPEDIVFRAGFRRGHAVAEGTVSQIEAHPAYVPTEELTARNIQHDVALLRLAQPIPTSDLNPIVVYDRVVTGGSVSMVSYGQDRETLPSRQDRCQIKDTYQDVILFDCEATFGSSGAPVMREVNGTRQIVSVVSGGGEVDGERLTFGMVLPKRVAELQHRMWVNKPKPVASIKRVQVGSGASAGGAKFIRP